MKKDSKSLFTIPEPNGNTLNRPSEEAYDDKYLAACFQTFHKYNADKTKFLYDQLPLLKKIVYDLIPFFLHTDASELLKDEKAVLRCPSGVFGYQPNRRTAWAYVNTFSGKSLPTPKDISPHDPSLPIKSVSLMGSMGSIAQNNKSDFDYWVCVDQQLFKGREFSMFKKKLCRIEQWAAKFAGAEVHFFPMDLTNIKQDNFGSVQKESSGSAQGNLLKEEFYRSMTLVAGQTPLWWIMPPGVDDAEYKRLSRIIHHSVRLDSERLLDMGNLHNIAPGEFFGAAIWHISKTIGSPFKSVLKLALLEEYLLSRTQGGLLADELKKHLFDNHRTPYDIDPYVLMFDRATAYLKSKDRLKEVDLLRRSFYLKVQAQLDPKDQSAKELPRKKRMMLRLIDEWKWHPKKIGNLNRYHLWTFAESHHFSSDINNFLFKTYGRIIGEIKRRQDDSQVTISRRDLKLLHRKLYVFYSRRPNKVDSIKNLIEAPPTLAGITLQKERNEYNQKVWSTYRGLISRENAMKLKNAALNLRQCPHLGEILIWLVNNRMYDSGTTININSGAKDQVIHCTVPDIQQLLTTMMSFFPTYKYHDIDEKELLQDPEDKRMLLIVNLDEPDRSQEIVDTCVCYQNNWGEVFFEHSEKPVHCLRMARSFLARHFDDYEEGRPHNFRIFLSSRHNRSAINQLLSRDIGMETWA